MTPLPADQPITVTMAAQEWNIIHNVLLDAAWPPRVSHPIMQKLVEQFQAAAQAAEPDQPVTEPQRGNGVDEHAPH